MEPFMSLLRMGSSLLLVLGLIGLSAYLGKRYFNGSFGPWRAAPFARILARSYLGAKKEIALVEVGGEYLVLGITPQQISLIVRLKESPLTEDPNWPSGGKTIR